MILNGCLTFTLTHWGCTSHPKIVLGKHAPDLQKRQKVLSSLKSTFPTFYCTSCAHPSLVAFSSLYTPNFRHFLRTVDDATVIPHFSNHCLKSWRGESLWSARQVRRGWQFIVQKWSTIWRNGTGSSRMNSQISHQTWMRSTTSDVN